MISFKTFISEAYVAGRPSLPIIASVRGDKINALIALSKQIEQHL